MFKLSALEVDKALGNDIPLENYSKMVLCRTCPVRSGTNFVLVPEDSVKGQLLKKIFMMDTGQKVYKCFCFTYSNSFKINQYTFKFNI